jgi:hypothetical protein
MVGSFVLVHLVHTPLRSLQHSSHNSIISSQDYFGQRYSTLNVLIDTLAPFTNYSFRTVAHSILNGGTFGAPSASSAIVRTLTFCKHFFVS